jgi:hypothetical protein
MYVNVVVGVDGRSGSRDAVALAPADIRLALAHVRVVAAVSSRGSSGALDVAERDRSCELSQLDRRSCESETEAETETETVSIAATCRPARCR